MNRLTKRSPYTGVAGAIDEVARLSITARLAAYEDTGMEPEEIENTLNRFSALLCEVTNSRMSKTNYTMEAMFAAVHDAQREDCEQYCDLKQAETEGRLVVLPCKVGDTVYYRRGRDVIGDTVERIILDGIDNQVLVGAHKAFMCWDFGRNVFLTREEAEAAQRKEQGDGND